MTGAEWLAHEGPGAMLAALKDRVSDRKLRLFLVASARLVWDRVPEGPMRAAVEASERYADGSETAEQLDADRNHFYTVAIQHPTDEPRDWLRAPDRALVLALVLKTSCTDRMIRTLLANTNWLYGLRPVHPQLVPLLKDIFGNPFRPVAFAPEWRTGTAVALADQMYESRDFGAMPILADALQDAGCEDPGVLDHCRGPGPHVRGCWVVDRVLGKE